MTYIQIAKVPPLDATCICEVAFELEDVLEIRRAGEDTKVVVYQVGKRKTYTVASPSFEELVKAWNNAKKHSIKELQYALERAVDLIEKARDAKSA